MATTAAFTLQAAVSGLPEGTEALSLAVTNSTSVGITNLVTITGIGSSNASTVSIPSDTKFALIVPNGTTSDIFISKTTNTTAGAFPIASTGFAFLCINPATVSTVLMLWVTTAITNTVRVSFY